MNEEIYYAKLELQAFQKLKKNVDFSGHAVLLKVTTSGPGAKPLFLAVGRTYSCSVGRFKRAKL